MSHRAAGFLLARPEAPFSRLKMPYHRLFDAGIEKADYMMDY